MRAHWITSFLLVVVASAASGQSLTPKPGSGGLVTIQGAPLPPVSKGSVRTMIRFYEPLLAAIRLAGQTAALARGYGFLATMYASIGDLSKAEKLFDDAQVILEEQGATGRDLGWLHNNRGLVHLDQQRYADALQSFRAAVAALTAEREDLLEFRVPVLQNLATTQQFFGNVEASEDGYLEALDILRRLKKGNDRAERTTLVNLAGLYHGINDFAAARRILEDLEERPHMDKTMRFVVLTHLGFAVMGLGDFDGAEQRFKSALELTAEGSNERTIALMNLAAMYAESGNVEHGRREGEKALRLAEEVYGPDARMTAVIVGTLGTLALARGDLAKADSLLMRTHRALSKLPGDEEVLAGVMQNLAIVAQRRDQRDRALALSRQALDLKTKHLERILAFGSETQRLAYRANAYPYDQLANLGDAMLLVEAVLTTKGAVIESLLAERSLVRASRSPEDIEQLDRLQELKLELMEAIGRGEQNTEEVQRALKKQETALAKRFARPVQRQQRRVDLARVQNALEDHQVLIEIIRYRRHEGGMTRTPWYGGIIIPTRGDPVWVPLVRAKVVDDATETLLTRMNRGNRGGRVDGQADIESILRSLDETLWKPLANAFPDGTRKVLLSPDGATSFIPWAALLDEHGTLLADRCEVTQVGSGRDLVRTATSPAENTILALADGGNDLPYSRQEVEQIAISAKQRGWRATILVDEQASELALFQHRRPRVLHFATHGGQLNAELEEGIESRLGANPMYRGYLLLGGGNRTRLAWKRGSLVPFAEDGVLTAEEVGGLDLRDTWLTVLSACRTGAGDAMTGEGVLGLRRGFMLAGTENLLFSLWSVDDAATAQFMTAFYERLFRTGDVASAFHETQVAELRHWRKAGRTVSDVVHRAGAFVLTK